MSSRKDSGSGSGRPRVSVLVADEFPIVRRGVAAAVRRRWDLELVGEAGDGAEALHKLAAVVPDVAVIDEQLPLGDGPQIAAALAAAEIPTRVLILSSGSDGRSVQRAIAAGARGYVTKRSTVEEICEAIRRVGAGESYLSEDAAEELWRQLRRGEPPVRVTLTPRETEILRLVALGSSSAAIGAALHLSVSTVRNHQRHLYEKLGVSSGAAAVYRAMRQGILT